MKTVTCRRVELSPDKWEKIHIVFGITEDKKYREKKITLPRVERKEVRVEKVDKETGQKYAVKEVRDINAFHNGHFTDGFTTKAAGLAVDTFYPKQKTAVCNYRQTINAVAKEVGHLKRSPLLIDVTVAAIRQLLDNYVGMDDKQFDAWNLYCSTVDRVSLFGREGGDKEADETLEAED